LFSFKLQNTVFSRPEHKILSQSLWSKLNR